MSPEVDRKVALNTQRNRIPIGRNRFLAISFAGLLLAACESAPSPGPSQITHVQELTPYRIAELCQIEQQDRSKGMLNPNISKEEEDQIINMVLDLEGRNNFPSHPSALSMSIYSSLTPTLSPDSTKILYNSRNGETIIIDRDSSNKVSLDPPPVGLVNRDAEWWNEGREIIFTRYDLSEKSQAVHTVSLDGSRKVQLTRPSPGVSDWIPTPLANGRLAFVRNDSSRKDEDGSGFYSQHLIFTMKPDGSDLKEVKISDFPEGYKLDTPYSISPDRKKIAFIVQEGNQHMVPIEGGGGYSGRGLRQKNSPLKIYDAENDQLWQINVALPGYSIRWVANGEYLIFRQKGRDNLSEARFLTRLNDAFVAKCPDEKSPYERSPDEKQA